tara:strand:- start:384 stop:560 length:177 start_codon:yes stop_codon:yes gene_type:complete
MYDLVDEACANELNVSVETYIEKIEKTTMKRAEVIIGAIFSEDPNLIKKAKRIFNLIN